MTDTTDQQAVTVAQEDRREALIERLGTIADLACATPLPGDLGDVAYDLLRQAAAQISSDRLHIARLASVSSASADYVLVPREPTQDQLIAGNGMFHTGEVPLNIYRAMLAASPEPVPATNQAGEVERIADDEALEAVADCFNGSDIYGRTEAWTEGKTLSVLFKGTGQIAKLRFAKLVDKPSNADLRGEPA